MKYVICFALCISASVAEARTRVKVGIFGTSVRTTDCGVNIQASRCGVQFNGGGHGCNSGGCGEAYHGGGCGTGQAHHYCATCPQNGCVPCGGQQSNHCPPYGTRTRTCIDSNVPYLDPAAQMQMRYRGF